MMLKVNIIEKRRQRTQFLLLPRTRGSPSMALDLRLNGDGWQGTYATVLRCACVDLLADGAPIGGVTFWIEGWPTVDGVTVTEVRDDVIVARTAAGQEVLVNPDEVTRMTIP